MPPEGKTYRAKDFRKINELTGLRGAALADQR
jgi:hypothetical protein